MKYGIIGTGKVGATIGNKAASEGVEIVFGSRDPKIDEARLSAPVVGVSEAIEQGDVVLLAVPGKIVEDFLQQYKTNLRNKTIIDATNQLPFGRVPNNNYAIVSKIPGAKYARAFSMIGVSTMKNPQFGTEVADMFYAADPPERKVVETLVHAIGMRPIALGNASQGELVDAFLLAWDALAHEGHGRQRGFRVLGIK